MNTVRNFLIAAVLIGIWAVVVIAISESTVPCGMRIQAEFGNNAVIICWGDSAKECLDRFEGLIGAAVKHLEVAPIEDDDRYQHVGRALALKGGREP